MANLAQFLRLLERDGVSEIAFQAGSQPAMAVGGKYVAVSPSQLTNQHITSLLSATPFAHQLPADENAQHEEVVKVGDKDYAVVLRRQNGRTLLRYRFAGAAPAAAGAVAATPAARAVETAPDPVPDSPLAPPETAARSSPRIEAAAPDPTSISTSTPDPSVCEILRAARTRGISDVHIMAERPVSMRKIGKLVPEGESLSAQRVEQMLMSIVHGLRREQLSKQGYADFALQIVGAGMVRVNVSKQATGLKGSFRMMSDEIPTLEQLGLPPELEKVRMYHQGLAIVSGPNGHGKTTTLTALVNLINTTKASHIITVEDPVEVTYPFAKAVVSQREVGVHTASFARALKAALREDPDVIVIGELRDLETVEIALEAAETGHLVITTMSTRSGAKTIDRLIDMFPTDKQSAVRATLAGALKMIASQRLLPNVSGDRLVAATELITGNIQLWNLIRDNKLLQLPSLMQRGRSIGMIRLDESLIDLVRRGEITQEVAMAAAENPPEVLKKLGESPVTKGTDVSSATAPGSAGAGTATAAPAVTPAHNAAAAAVGRKKPA